MRRRKGRTAGCAPWQFNEPWPAICWSLVDYARNGKPAYRKLKELYNPVLVSFYYPLVPRRPGGKVKGELWLVNDTLSPVEGELAALLNDSPVLRLPARVGPNAAIRLSPLEVTLGDGENVLRLELTGIDGVVSTNEYDLNYVDRGKIGWTRARAADIGDRMMS
jgi:hypothetical protein